MDLPITGKPRYDDQFMAFFRAKFPFDLKVISVWVILAILGIYLPVLNTSPFRVVFALPMVLFIPGYVLIAALFPGKKDIDNIERIALSFGLSIAIVPLIGLGLNYTPWGIRLAPVITSLVIFTTVMIVVGHLRRAILASGERFEISFVTLPDHIRKELFTPEDRRIDRILSIILICTIVGAVGTTLYVITVPKEGEHFTEFYILGDNRMASDYPERIFVGAGYPLYIGIGNHEYRNVTYAVEIWATQMNFDETSNSSSISNMKRLDTFTVMVPDNQTEILPFVLKASSTGYNRVDFLLFNETIPSNSVNGMDRINESYRDLHLWVTIRDQMKV
jgi:uncharacterized membrane protein